MNCQKCWSPHLSSKALHDTFPFLLFAFSLSYCFCLGEYGVISLFLNHSNMLESVLMLSIDLYRARFCQGGASASQVHRCRTYGSSARLYSEGLCCLAYFTTISNGPAPNWSFGWELTVDRGRERVERISQRENGQCCQGRGPPRPEWHTLNRWQGPECWPTGILQRDGWFHTVRDCAALLPFLLKFRTDIERARKYGSVWISENSRAQTITAWIRICVLEEC